MGAEIKDRAKLQDLFSDGTIPTAADFQYLIDAVLVKRDDQFLGKWSPDTGYQKGDVVLHENAGRMSIYVLGIKKNAADCAADCGKTPPHEGGCWQLIHLDISDGDWEIVENQPNTMYAKVYGKIGIGTHDPQAFLHLNTEGGQFLFNPSDEASKMKWRMTYLPQSEGSEGCQQLDNTLNEAAASWLTNTELGFAFKKYLPTEPQAAIRNEGDSEEKIQNSTPKHYPDTPHTEGGQTEEILILLVNSKGKKPRVGIGTDAPTANLHIQDAENGNAILLHTETETPCLTLLKTTEEGTFESVQTIDNQFIAWSTNAALSYVFRNEKGAAMLTLHPEGKVGIGTDNPTQLFEIVDKKGELTFDTTNGTAVLDIVNNLVSQQKIHFKLAAQAKTSALISNAKNGFLFQNGRLKQMMSIEPEENTPNFNQNIEGAVSAKGVYVKLMTGDHEPLVSGLEFIKDLKPEIGCYEGDDHIQMGFSADSTVASEFIREFPNGQKGIAQHNLIAALVKTVQELEARIKDLEGKTKK